MRLDSKLQEFDQDLLVMASRVRKSFSYVLEALVDFDKEKALTVIELDDYVNHDEKTINDTAIETLSLLQPVAKDLRLIIGGIKIANDLERIGDYAKNIARYIIKNNISDAKLNDEIHQVGEQFIHYFDDVMDVLKDKDLKYAYEVAVKDEILDSAIDKIIYRIADKAQKDFSYSVEELNILRNVERAGDHGKNICEHIIYIVKGHHVDFG